MSYVQMIGCSKYYKMGNTKIIANNDINFSIEKGEFVLVLGPSGSGKSTILNVLGGMDKCEEGDVIIDDIDISKFNQKELTNYRRNDVGFIFQFYNLIPNLTVLENVELASQIAPDALNAKDTLEKVGLLDRLNNFPAQLSGGEQQRVAIARALAKNPKLLLCDEPTGALDYHTGKAILKLLQHTCEHTRTTVIFVTHNNALKPIASKVIEMSDSKIKNIKINKHPVSIDSIEW